MSKDSVGYLIHAWCFIWIEILRNSDNVLVRHCFEFECRWWVCVFWVYAAVIRRVVEECGVKYATFLLVVLYCGRGSVLICPLVQYYLPVQRLSAPPYSWKGF